MKSIRVMIDIDGILANFDEGYKEVLKNNFNINIDTNIIRDWNYSDAYPEITKEIDKKAWEIMNSDPYFWINLPPHRNNVRQISLIATNTDLPICIYYVTARVTSTSYNTVFYQTKHWLKTAKLWENRCFGGLIFSKEKSKVAEALSLHYAIDDKVSNLDNFPKSCKTFLYTRPWNINYPNELTRVKDLKEFFSIITEDKKRGA
jgi:hypothetical protein